MSVAVASLFILLWSLRRRIEILKIACIYQFGVNVKIVLDLPIKTVSALCDSLLENIFVTLHNGIVSMKLLLFETQLKISIDKIKLNEGSCDCDFSVVGFLYSMSRFDVSARQTLSFY